MIASAWHIHGLWKWQSYCRVPSSEYRVRVNSGLLTSVQHGTDDLAMQFYGPDSNEGKYGDEPSVDMPRVTAQLCDQYVQSRGISATRDTDGQRSFQPLMKLARKAVRVSIRDHGDLDEWISDDGPLVLIGEAAHPFPVSSSNLVEPRSTR